MLQQQNLILKAKLQDRTTAHEKCHAKLKKTKEAYRDLKDKHEALRQKDRRILAAYRQMRLFQLRKQLYLHGEHANNIAAPVEDEMMTKIEQEIQELSVRLDRKVNSN